MAAILPRNSTRQADALRYGNIARLTNRITGVVIVGFVTVHVLVQAMVHSGWFGEAVARSQFLLDLQQVPLVHAILFFSIAFHTLWGMKLFLGDLGYVYHYKTSLFVVGGIASLFALREALRYVGL